MEDEGEADEGDDEDEDDEDNDNYRKNYTTTNCRGVDK